MTNEASALKFLREIRGLSIRKAGALFGTSDAFVNHSENGRIDITPTLIMKFLNAYGFEFEDCEQLVDGKNEIPENQLK